MDILEKQLFAQRKAVENRYEPKMIGEHENSFCPTCGGRMHPGLATIPFILNDNRIVVIKNVPAEICNNCHEPFMNGRVTDEIMALLNQLQTLGSEVSVLSFPEYALA